MRDVMPEIDRWLAAGEPVALATVVQTWGSSPRAAGAKMAITPSGGMAGSVSGGCVEGATYEEALAALKRGEARLVHYGVADETAWEVGLACGGSIDVLVQPLDTAVYARIRANLLAERAFAVATVVQGPGLGQAVVVEDAAVTGQLPAALEAEAVTAARAALTAGRTQRAPMGQAEVFIEVSWPSPTLIVVGGVHTAIALTTLAKTLGYRTVVVDPRQAFGSEARFPHVDQLVHAWPDDALAQVGISRATAVAMLTHDPKLDDPGLLVALRSPAFYVGALGSPGTQQKRRLRLAEAGLTPEALARLRGPIGLDLGGRTPEEVALAIMAEIVAARNGRLQAGERAAR